MQKSWALWMGIASLVGAQACADDPADAPLDGSASTTLDASTSAAEAGSALDSAILRADSSVTPDAAKLGERDAAGSAPDASPVATSDGSALDASGQDAATSLEAGAPEAGIVSGNCPAGAALKAGDSAGTVTVGGVERTYVLHVPKSYTGMTVVPLVLDFHGLSSSGSGQKGVSGYQALSDKEGFVIAWPNGIDRAWNVGPCCTKARTVDDVGFAKALVAKLKSEGCIDAKRVYAAGFSMGGGMSHQLGCNAADVFAAIAPAAFDLLIEEEQPCRPARPLTVIAFRSSNDPLVKYPGGSSTPPTQGYSLPDIHFRGAEASTKHWAELNTCTGTPMDMGGGCKSYTQCAASVEVTLCTSATAGHAPGDATKGWAALKRFSLP